VGDRAVSSDHGVADTEVTPFGGQGTALGSDRYKRQVGFLRKGTRMRKNKGFTLIELMVVILIVAILAAVLAPMLTGRINEAKWTEGKAAAGTIATAIRAYNSEHEGIAGTDGSVDISAGLSGAGGFVPVGITDADLRGKYFTVTNYSVGTITRQADGTVIYTITITAPTGLKGQYTLDETGTWSYTP
jgi:type IV pilus assembly protein PilA